MEKTLLLENINLRDPFILPDDGKYYLYGSRGSKNFGESFGFDVYVSDDLKHWSEPKEIFAKSPDFWGTKNFWAPEVHKYHGKYYMFASFKSDTACRGTQILVSDTPDGKFVPLTDEPVTPRDWECLDGTLYIDKDGTPYMIFCHEWLQVHDGEMCAMKLTPDLKKAEGAPVVLFRASEPAWANKDEVNYITDGPFLYKTKNGRLLMIWSSSANDNYVEAVSYSDNGEITGNWKHCDKLLFEKDGGHGMIFQSFEGTKYFVLHAPNIPPGCERPRLIKIIENNDTLEITN